MDRGQFTFYRSFWEAVKELPPKGRAEVICAVCEYVFDEHVPQLAGVSKVIFSLIKPTLDTAARKAANGKQGGSKPKANGKQNESKKEEEKEKEVEVEKEIEIEKESYISPPLPPLPKTPPHAPAHPPKQPMGTVRFEALSGDDGFETFWAAYPKKHGDIREACRMYLEAIDTGATLQQMLDALEWQKNQDTWMDQGGRYIPSAAKWLQNRAWLQKPIKAAAASTRKDAPSMDYGKPEAAEYKRMQQLLAKMDKQEPAAKAVRDGAGRWYCGKCKADLGNTEKPGHCPSCGVKLIWRET